MNREHLEPVALSAAVITVSTTRNETTDSSGKTIMEMLTNAGIPVEHYSVVADRVDAIRMELLLAMKKCNCIILNGGTGLTHDDCTIEAVTPLLDKTIDGFGELFRLKSYEEIGSSAMLSRAVAGISSGKAVFCIPGSTGAVRLAVQALIIPEIRHILTHANK
jgi:molybdenum cofactor biosynthesis protein B